MAGEPASGKAGEVRLGRSEGGWPFLRQGKQAQSEGAEAATILLALTQEGSPVRAATAARPSHKTKTNSPASPEAGSPAATGDVPRCEAGLRPV